MDSPSLSLYMCDLLVWGWFVGFFFVRKEGIFLFSAFVKQLPWQMTVILIAEQMGFCSLKFYQRGFLFRVIVDL